MAHVRQQIRDAFKSVLAGMTGVKSLQSGRAFALNPEQVPAVSIQVDTEAVVFSDADGDLDRQMTVEVIVSTIGGENSDDVLDDIAVQVESRVLGATGAPWDGALDLRPPSTDFVIGEPGEKTPYALRMRFPVRLISDGPEQITAS